MPIGLSIGPILQDERSPIDLSTLIDYLRVYPGEFSTRLADALYQVQVGIQFLEALLREQVPLDADAIEIFNSSLELVGLLNNDGLGFTTTGGNATLSAANGLSADKGGSSAQLYVDASYYAFLKLLHVGGKAVTAEANASTSYVQADEFRVAGTKVVGAQVAGPALVTGTAGATYTATEQALINTLVNTVNSLRANLISHGLIV